jgi:hypothetical protein
MHGILITFELPPEHQEEYFETARSLSPVWEKKGFLGSLFQNTAFENRFVQMFFTEDGVDSLTQMIQTDPGTKKLFDIMKSAGGRVEVSVLEKRD